jgi:hypothetical protein
MEIHWLLWKVDMVGKEATGCYGKSMVAMEIQ